jgi:hypothetical protein
MDPSGNARAAAIDSRSGVSGAISSRNGSDLTISSTFIHQKASAGIASACLMQGHASPTCCSGSPRCPTVPGN